jgi:hypothetical protein
MALRVNYQPLGQDEIRLLRLTGLAHEHGQPIITCQLEHFDRNIRPQYFAVSYAWGRGGSTKSIKVADRICDVGSTIEEALRHLLPNLQQWVWIDQICINQEDKAEKSDQVSKMGDIYSEAARVVAWLGPEADNSDILFKHLQDVGRLLEIEDYKSIVPLYSDEQQTTILTGAWRRFCQRPYWKRLWIIQEYTFARDLQLLCGDMYLPVNALHWTLLFTNRLTQKEEIFPSSDDQKKVHRMYKTPDTSFMEGVCLRRSRYWALSRTDEHFFRVLVTSLVVESDYNYPLTTDDHDRIFSILPLAGDAADFDKFPDYRMSCGEVYEETALVMLRQGHIDVLSFSQFHKPRMPGLATWVPDWSMEVRRPCCHPPWVNYFSASGKTLDKQRITSPRSGAVTLAGFIVDEVLDVADTWDPDWLGPFNAADALRFLSDIEKFCAKSPRIPKDQEGADAARIAIADNGGSDILQWPEWCHLSLTEARKLLEDHQSQNTPQVLDLQHHYYLKMLHYLPSQRPFITATGYVGISASHTLPGDKICVFFGSQICYTLRLQKDGSYHLVGEAYVHGIMCGELVTSAVKCEDFTLT